ncbi:hypothetical protein [Psychromicrobium xiongbiense]|uniref:hypothetical protein n=1 Tax=Psychromicrobium xiongbiense TaxID=3051184 RepID=UPI0025550170|nr:hypothetical protein [Psychromicrobium sp. YIM S02556]
MSEHELTRTEMRQQVIDELNGAAERFDVECILDEVMADYGPIGVRQIDPRDFWEIVAFCDFKTKLSTTLALTPAGASVTWQGDLAVVEVSGAAHAAGGWPQAAARVVITARGMTPIFLEGRNIGSWHELWRVIEEVESAAGERLWAHAG